MKQRFLIIVHGDVEPELFGPYGSGGERNEAAKEHRDGDPNQNDGIYILDIEAGQFVSAEVDSYSSGFFEEEKEEPLDQEQFLNYYRCSECGYEWSSHWSCASNDECPSCHTSDIEPHASEEKCESCEGTGYVGASGHEQECDHCHGTGYY